MQAGNQLTLNNKVVNQVEKESEWGNIPRSPTITLTFFLSLYETDVLLCYPLLTGWKAWIAWVPLILSILWCSFSCFSFVLSVFVFYLWVKNKHSQEQACAEWSSSKERSSVVHCLLGGDRRSSVRIVLSLCLSSQFQPGTKASGAQSECTSEARSCAFSLVTGSSCSWDQECPTECSSGVSRPLNEVASACDHGNLLGMDGPVPPEHLQTELKQQFLEIISLIHEWNNLGRWQGFLPVNSQQWS